MRHRPRDVGQAEVASGVAEGKAFVIDAHKVQDGGMQVVNVQPGSLLVLSGGLGPLQFLGVSGSMTISFAPKEAGTHVSLRYVVGGYDPDKFAKWPAAVDLVLGAFL